MQIRFHIPSIRNGVLTMSKMTSGIVLFSLLMALSLGVAFAESEVVATENATENATVNETANVTINETVNATINATINNTENVTEAAVAA
jgi:hypothetical protein